MKYEIFNAHNGSKVKCKIWDAVKHPIGVVQIVHDIDETPQKYERFAEFLNKQGYIAIANCLRLHNETSKDVFADTVVDEFEILKSLKEKYQLPVFVFGHGYGSLIIQRLIEQTQLCTAGVCMSGTARYSLVTLWAGLLCARIGGWIRGKNAHARVIELWSPIKSKRLSYGFYLSLFQNLIKLNHAVCPKMPLLIICGGRDVASANVRLADTLYHAYRMHNMENLTFIIYPEIQRNLLHDCNYMDVQNDILRFLNHRNFYK